MRKSIIVLSLLEIALLFAGLTACTKQKKYVEDNTEPAVTLIEASGEVYENAATGIGIVFPSEYIGKYTIFQSNVDMFSIFHNATHTLFKEKDPDSERGALFSIEKWPISAQEDIAHMNETAIPLFQTDEFEYFLKQSTPMDCYTDDMENLATKEYIALYDDNMINEIMTSAYLLADTDSALQNEKGRVNEDDQNAAYDLITDLIPKAAKFYGGVFNGSGHFKEDKTVTIPGFEDYALVADDDIKSVAELKAWVESIVTPEVAKIRFYKYIVDIDLPLSSFDRNYYRPLYYEYDGRLYVDTMNGGHGFAFDWLYDTIKIISFTDTEITAEIDRLLFGEPNETSVIKLENRDGRWLIANDFIDKADEDISRLSAMAFADILEVYPAEENGFEWDLATPDKKAEFFWGGNTAGLYVDTRPFETAGLDVTKLEGAGNSVFIVYIELDKEPGKTSAINDFRGIVTFGWEKVSYDAKSGYFSFDVGNGNFFRWTKDISGNGMDVIYELNSEPLIEAGLDPNSIEGWEYTQVKVEMEGTIIDEWKLIKSF